MTTLGSQKNISELITTLERFYESGHVMMKVVPRPNVLLSGLRELDSMIGIENIKQSIANQIITFLISSNSKMGLIKRFTNEMIHFCMLGPPGVGKSRTAKIIAKIWHGIGLDLRIKNGTESNETKLVKNSSLALDSLKNLSDKLRIALKDSDQLLDIQSDIQKVNILMKDVYVLSDKIGDTSENSDEEIERKEKRVIRSRPQSPARFTNLSQSAPNSPVMSPVSSKSLLHSIKPETPVKVSRVRDDPNLPESDYFVLAGRDDVIAPYSGQTAALCKKFIKANRGKVIIFEEAYNLCSGEKDQYGMEALTIICRAMDEDSSENAFGFNGYIEDLNNSIFKFQPGIKRRICYSFETKGYSFEQITKIFIGQLNTRKFKISEEVPISSFFEKNYFSFSAFGGDTMRLVNCVEDAYCTHNFEALTKNEEEIPLILTLELLEAAFLLYKM